MGERIIHPKFNVHENYKRVNIINPYRYGTPPPTGDPIQAETTAYMNAMGVPNDSTATIYGKTGAEVWQLFNSCIMIAKNAGKLGDIYTWYPMYGVVSDKLKYNALSPGTYNREFYGSWIFSELGNKGNGSNTNAREGSFALNPLNINDCGFTIASNSNESSGSNDMEYGARGSNEGYVILSIKRNNAEIRGSIGVNTTALTYPVSTAEGITSVSRTSGILKLWKNSSIVNSTTASGSNLPNIPASYGAYMNINSPTFFSKQRLLSEVLSKGDDATMEIVHQMIDTWEAGLNRKTW